MVIVVAEVVSFAVSMPGLGFYYDDWVFMGMVRRDGWLPVLLNSLSLGAIRPGQGVYHSILYALSSDHAVVGHVVILALEIIQGLLFFLVIDRIAGSRRFALLAACLAIMHPSRLATHVWISDSVQTLALDLALASLALLFGAPGPRGWFRVLASQVLFLAGGATYEACAFVPLLAAGGLAVKDADRQKPFSWGPVMSLWPYGVSLIALLIWLMKDPLFSGHASAVSGPGMPKAIALSAANAGAVLLAGCKCLTMQALRVDLLPEFLRETSPALLVLWAAFPMVAAAVLTPREKPTGHLLKVNAAMIVCGFLAAYLPYTVVSGYEPLMEGLNSRVNGTGALVGGLIAAAGVHMLTRWRGIAAASLWFVVASFTAVNWTNTRQWARVWSDSDALLSRAAVAAAGLPSNSTVLLAESFPKQLFLFHGRSDFSAALRWRTGREDLSGDIITGQNLSYGRDSMVVGVGRYNAETYPYKDLYVFSEDGGELRPVKGPP